MKSIQIVGVVVLAVDVVLIGFAYHTSNAPVDQTTNTLTGRLADGTMWYPCLGVAATLQGLFGKPI